MDVICYEENTFYKQRYMYISNISALHMAWKCFAINLNLLSKQLIKGFIAQNILKCYPTISKFIFNS